MTSLHRFSLALAAASLLAAPLAHADEAPMPEPDNAPAVEGSGDTADDGRKFAVGAFIGAAAPSETFGVGDAEASLDQGFIVGIRAGRRVGHRFDIELEGTYGTAGVRESNETATILAGRLQVRGLLNPDADATVFAVVGLGAIASLEAEPLIDETTRATGHYGAGVQMAVNEMAAVRLEARHIIGRGNDDGLSSMGELHIGGAFAF